MSSIDLAILGMVIEKSQSAYDIQKDVDYHHFSRWTKISVPSIYRKVIKLADQGYLKSDVVKGEKFADKAIYSITDKGRAYFEQLMNDFVNQQVPLLFDFNVVIANLNRLDKQKAMGLVAQLRNSITISKQTNKEYAEEYYSYLPLVGKTIFNQQQLLYNALLEWIDTFEKEYRDDQSMTAKSSLTVLFAPFLDWVV